MRPAFSRGLSIGRRSISLAVSHGAHHGHCVALVPANYNAGARVAVFVGALLGAPGRSARSRGAVLP